MAEFFFRFEDECGDQIDHHAGTFAYADGGFEFFLLTPVDEFVIAQAAQISQGLE